MRSEARGDDDAAVRRRYRDLEFAVREGTMLVDHDGRVRSVVRVDSLIGCGAVELVGGPPVPSGWTLVGERGEALEAAEHPAASCLRSAQVVERVLVHRAPDGSTSLPLRFRATPVDGDADVAVDVFVSDPHRRRRSMHRLVDGDDRFRQLTDVLPIAVWEASPTGQITYVNASFTELTGFTLDDVPDLPLLDIVHPDDLVGVMAALSGAAEHGDYQAQYRVVHVDGSARWVISRMGLLREGAVITGYVGTLEDVNELHESRREATRLAGIVEAASDAIAIVEDGAETYANAAARAMLAGLAGSEATAELPFGAQLAERYVADLEPVLRAHGEWSGETRFTGADGEPIDVWMQVHAEVEGGRVVRSVLMARDIREQKRRERTLEHAATHDSLTGLANRAGFEEAMGRAAGEPGALVYVDVDRFKAVNDRHGHQAGDEVLVEIGSRLRELAERADRRAVVSRLGGDELVVWVPGASGPDVVALASGIVRAIGSTPVDLAGSVSGAAWCAVTATVGAAVGCVDGDGELARRADAALYAAKAAGRARFVVDEG